jgi:Outer membrane protein beta-barrel domain
MPRCLVYFLPFALVVLAPAVSLAANDDCPDGWFCEPNAAPPPPAPSQPPGPSPASRPPEPGTPPRPGLAPGYAPPGHPVPGYPPPPRDPNAEPSIEVPPEPPPPKHRRRRGFREWGFNVHLEVALLGNNSARPANTGMGGLGFGFRYRPLPPLAFEAGIDLLKGTDQQGFARSEAALLLNTLVFFNPHDVVQVYGLAGLSFSGANVTVAPRADDTYFKRHEEHYSYFGGQLGLGVEVRVSRSIAIAGDLLGFVRGRTDNHSDDAPEFIDSNSPRVNDTVGGGLLRAGVTFYW